MFLKQNVNYWYWNDILNYFSILSAYVSVKLVFTQFNLNIKFYLNLAVRFICSYCLFRLTNDARFNAHILLWKPQLILEALLLLLHFWCVLVVLF